MHELSIVQSLISLAEAELDHAGQTGQVISLTVRVGLLSGVHPEAMKFAFEVISSDSRVKGSRLNIVETPALSTCRSCGNTIEVDLMPAECPLCGNNDIEISGGNELFLESIEVAETEDSDAARG